MPVKPPRGQVAHFRIYPEPGLSSLFFHVRIFQTVEAMHAYVRTRPGNPARPGRFCKGMCSWWTRISFRSGRGRTHPELGEIVLARRWLTMRIISHECTHAALAWARRRRVDVAERGRGQHVSGGEERFCGALGDMARQIAAYMWDHGLAK